MKKDINSDKEMREFLKNVKQIPDGLKKKILKKFEELPCEESSYNERGIKINEELIVTTIEILNSSIDKILPQNCRNLSRNKTPFGLDRYIKEKLNNDTRRANIISDELAKKDIVQVTKRPNPKTGRSIKHTLLKNEWTY
jgi:hypothetical protein